MALLLNSRQRTFYSLGFAVRGSILFSLRSSDFSQSLNFLCFILMFFACYFSYLAAIKTNLDGRNVPREPLVSLASSLT